MDSWLVGSSPDCDIVIDQPSVSGHHCQLTRKPDGFYLEDLDSTNGTFINGQRLTSAQRVTEADSITLGKQVPLPLPAATPAKENPSPAPGIPSSAMSRPKYLIPAVVGALILLGIGVFAGRQLFNSSDESAEKREEPVNERGKDGGESTGGENSKKKEQVNPPLQAAAKEGFRMGNFHPDDEISRIKVTVYVGEGGDLDEPVDLHLGTGFPFRLFPLGSENREPAFAAVSQRSSLAAGQTNLVAGEEAWFEFRARPTDNGYDELRTTPELMADLCFADIQRIGFSSPGETDWVLKGYKIEINGELFAENGSVNARPNEIQTQNRNELDQKLFEAGPLAQQVMELEQYVAVKLASDIDKKDLATASESLQRLEGPINRLRGQVEGVYPWYTEQDPGFKVQPVGGPRPKKVVVKLLAGGAERAGSQNPVYLKAGGHKYVLSSEDDPLEDDPEVQEFVIPVDALEFDPVSLADLDRTRIGIGMVANDRDFNRIPDRAQLQRVILQVSTDESDDPTGAKPRYDSEQHSHDRESLALVSLVPPAHRDDVGFISDYEKTSREISLWKPGLASPPGPPGPPERGPPDTFNPNLGNPNTGGPNTGGPNTPKTAGPKKGVPSTGVPNTPKTAGPKKGVPSTKRPARRAGPGSRRRPKFPIVVTNIIKVQAPRAKNPQPVKGPTTPVIANVRIKQAAGEAIQFRKPCEVTWELRGNSLNVKNFRVDLVPVLPHRSTPFVPADMGNGKTSNKFTTSLKVTPRLDASKPWANSSDFLYVQPRVTALKAGGGSVASNTGPILPIFPAGNRPNPLYRTDIGAIPQLVFVPMAPLAPGQPFPPLPAFNFLGNQAGRFVVNWPNRNIAAIGGVHAGTRAGAWPLDWANAPQVSHTFKFDAYKALSGGRSSFAYNSKIQPITNANEVLIQFAAVVSAGAPLPKRVVAHYGFLGSGIGRTAQWQASVQIVNAGVPALPTLQWIGNQIAQNGSNGGDRKLKLIEIPLNFTVDPGTLPPAPPPVASINSDGGEPYTFWDTAPIVAPAPFYSYGELLQTGPQTRGIVVTFLLKHTGPPMTGDEALGLFGVRLVD